MSLGILNNISAIYAENSLNQTQASLQTVLQQLSSGSRINSGADDAAGLSVVNGLKANEAALAQSSQNATNGIGLLQTADGALAQVTSLLNRAVTLATESANSTLNTTQVSAANAEYQTILSRSATSDRRPTSAATRSLRRTRPTSSYPTARTAGANSYNDTVGVLTTASVGQTASSATISTSALASGTTVASAANVASTGTITLSTPTATLTGTIPIYLSNATPVTLTVSGLTGAQVATAINSNASFQSEGLSAAYDAVGGVLTITGPASGQGGSVTFGADGLTASAGTVTAAPGTAATDGRGTDTITLAATTNTVAGTFGLAVGGGAAHTINVVAGTSGSAFAQQINADATFQAENVTASYSSATGAVTVYGPSGVGSNFTQSGALTQTTVLSPGGGVNFTSSSISTLNASTAATVLTSVVDAIADVSYQRGLLGANINQLTAAAGVADTANVNLTSASNSIEATNYGQATSDLAKFEVLSQTGISALAQSNTVQQEILKLLQ